MFTIMDTRPDLSKVLYDWSVAFFRRSISEFNRFTRQSGLSMPQISVLTRLYYRGPCEINQLRELLHTTKAGAGQLVERMEQQGLVQRQVSTTDRRARVISLTDMGHQMVEASIAARENWMKDLLAKIPDEDRENAARVLQTLTNIALRLEKESWGDTEITITDPHMFQ
jgi:DNA-binding MarR family transcriptional regulator